MSNLSELYIKTEVLETLLKTVKAKGDKGLSITISTDDKSNEWGQNVAAYVSQSKEEREAKKNRFYVGNGKVFWTDGKITKGEKPGSSPSSNASYQGDSDTLPF